MIVTGISLDRARASADLPLAVGPAIKATGGFPERVFMFIATLVAKDRLSAGDISAAVDRLSGAGALGVEILPIVEGKASDLRFIGDPIAARIALDGQMDGIDVIIQRETERRRKLLVADMDSTMITIECIDELADYAGIKPEVAAVTEAAMRGELDFEDALRSRVALLAGLSEDIVAQCLAERVKIMPGARELVAAVHANGGMAVLVSGGFTHFAEPVGKMIGFDRVIANRLGFSDGRLNGTVEGAIVGASTKRESLLGALSEKGWGIAESLAVGDGANDIPMIEAAGLGVAYHAKPKTEAAAAAVRYGDLSAIAYAVSG
jgi:phosphoserine phosphatase